jgi:hypothetical protein
MINGFYNIEHFKLEDVQEFCIEAIKLAYLVRGESKYKTSSSRMLDENVNLDYILEKFKNTIGNFNEKNEVKDSFAVINRVIYNRGSDILDNPYEIAIHNSDWEFLYIFLNSENFDKLVNKYNLKLKIYQ